MEAQRKQQAEPMAETMAGPKPTVTHRPLNLTDEFVKLQACVHCGLCLDACPTYGVLDLEMDSPRGRLYLMRAREEGRIGLSDTFRQHMEQCLLCRACETACPSGVRFGEIMEHTRSTLHRQQPQSRLQRWAQNFVFRSIFPHPKRLERFVGLMRLNQRLGLSKMARALGLLYLLPRALREGDRMLPRLSGKTFRKNVERINPALGKRRHRVAMFSCCVNDLMLSEIDFATMRVLQRNGCEVVVLREQKCSGALHVHAGDLEPARDMARHNIDMFARIDVDAVITNSAGCGAQVRDYGHLLAEDPDYAIRAVHFSNKVREATEFLAGIEFIPPREGIDEEVVKVAYVDACHLAHAQGVRQQPRDLIASIPGIQMTPVENPDRCCGSAGIYNITQHELSMEILDQKIEDLKNSGAEIWLTGNPGCLMQIAYGAKRRGLQVEVLHPLVLLDRAYTAEMELGSAGHSRLPLESETADPPTPPS